MRVKDEDLKRMLELRARSDQLAFALGKLMVAHRDAELRLIVEGGGVPDNLRYGALHFERQQREAFFMQKLGEIRSTQAGAGIAALKAVGLDPDKPGEELTVILQGKPEEIGTVRRLVAGEWLDVKDLVD